MKPQNRVGHNIQSARSRSRQTPLYKSPHRSIISNTQFRDARIFGGMTREQAAAFLRVSVRTIGHWETGRARPSYAAFKLLRVYRHGDLIHPEWGGCSINHRGALVTPEGHELKPSDLAWLSLLFRRAEMMGPLLRERDDLRRQLQEIEHQATAGAAGDGPWACLLLNKSHAASAILPNSQTYQGFSWVSAVSCDGATMGPQWGHERCYPQAQSQVAYACSRGGQGSRPASGRLPERVHPVLHFGTGETHTQGVVVSSRSTSGQEKARLSGSVIGGPILGRPRSDDGKASACQGWPERELPMWQWSQGQALPSGVDLNRDASRNAGGAL